MGIFIQSEYMDKFKNSIVGNIFDKELNVTENKDIININKTVIHKNRINHILGNTDKIWCMFNKYNMFGCELKKFFKFEFIKVLEYVLEPKRRAASTYGVDVKDTMKLLDILKPDKSDEDFEKYIDWDAIKKNIEFELKPHQVETVIKYAKFKRILGYRGMLLYAGVGLGKEQPLKSKIRVPNGWKTMGEMMVGDKVVTPFGDTANVIGVFPQGKKAVYKITFRDGRTAECGIDHLWAVIDNTTSKGKDWNAEVNRILTTRQIIDAFNKYKNRTRLYVPLTNPEKNEPKDYIIDPYILGVLIGDGCITHSASIALWDEDVMINVKERLQPGYILKCNVSKDKKTGRIRKSQRIMLENSYNQNVYLHELKRLGLFGKRSYEKFIPEKYMNGSAEQRWELLRGLIDTDGTVSDPTKQKGRTGKQAKSGSISYATSSKELADNIQELVHSLGGLCRRGIKKPFYTHNGEKKEGKLSYVLHICFRNNLIATNRPFLKNRLKSEHQYSRYFKLGIRSIEYVRDDYTQCIMIDDPFHLYLTDNYVVTHNTITSVSVMESVTNEIDKVLIICPLPTLYEVWVKTLTQNGAGYRHPQEVYVIKDGKSYRNEKFIICHYEGLDKLDNLFELLGNQRVGIIIDESHNLNDLKSKRTQLALNLLDNLNTDNIVLLSGTPIKSGFKELIPMFRFLDRSFNANVEKDYFNLYKNANKFLQDVLKERFKGYANIVEKGVLKLDPVITNIVKVDIPEKELAPFYLKNIKIKMREYCDKRRKELEEQKEYWHNLYHSLVDKALSVNTKVSKSNIRTYKEAVEIIRSTRSFDYKYIQKDMLFANKFEKNEILPYLDKEDKIRFKDAKTIYKYPTLKIVGEALANIIGRARIDCHKLLARYLSYKLILNASEKKTIVFSNYIEVCDEAMLKLKTEGYNPIGCYGDSSKDLTKIVNEFHNNKDINPIVTTYKSLSTGVPLTAANTIICIDLPFRMYIYEQAVGRAWRLGQDAQVYVYNIEVNSNEPNISSRNVDIIKYFKEEVEKITGVPSSLDIGNNEEDVINGFISTENYLSTEVAVHKDPKRKQVEEYVLKYIAKIVTGDENINLYKDLFNRMSDAEFKEWMEKLRDKKTTLSIVVPNGSKNIKCSVENNMKIAKELGFDFFQNLKVGETKDNPGYTTYNKYMVIKLPIKRAAQLLQKKISIAQNSNKIDSLTGQVTNESKASKMSNPETQVLLGLGMNKSLIELLKMRGGDTGAMDAMNRMLMTEGIAHQSDIEMYSKGVKSTKTLKSYFNSMHIKNTL